MNTSTSPIHAGGFPAGHGTDHGNSHQAMGHGAGGHSAGHDTHAGHTAHDSGSNTLFGFWIYLMSDCLLFSVLFATFGVLAANTAGGPAGRDLFDLSYVLEETVLLLLSSFTFGLATLDQRNGSRGRVVAWLGLTFVLGAGFIGMEVHEFAKLIEEGSGPGTSAFLSAYFTLVGTHGLHVTCGLLWILVLMHQALRFGLDGTTRRRLACLGLFWHFLDLVWICVFTFVYLRDFT